jgi:hypothetical protein
VCDRLRRPACELAWIRRLACGTYCGCRSSCPGESPVLSVVVSAVDLRSPAASPAPVSRSTSIWLPADEIGRSGGERDGAQSLPPSASQASRCVSPSLLERGRATAGDSASVASRASGSQASELTARKAGADTDDLHGQDKSGVNTPAGMSRVREWCQLEPPRLPPLGIRLLARRRRRAPCELEAFFRRSNAVAGECLPDHRRM